jgi:hypothetical protein
MRVGGRDRMVRQTSDREFAPPENISGKTNRKSLTTPKSTPIVWMRPDKLQTHPPRKTQSSRAEWPQKWWPETCGQNLKEEKKIQGSNGRLDLIGPTRKSYSGAGE